MKKSGIIFAFAFLLCLLLPATLTQAASKQIKTLKAGTTYSSYDFTGDGKADKLLIKTSKTTLEPDFTYISKTTLYLNSKKVWSAKDNCQGTTLNVQLITLTNGTRFLYLRCPGSNDDGVCRILQYRNKKIVNVVDFQEFYGNYGVHQFGTIVKVSKNTVTVRASVMSWALGSFACDFKYTYKDGTLKRSSTGTITSSIITSQKKEYFTAAQSITVYKTAGGSSEAFTLKTGTKVQIAKCYVKSSKVYFQVTTKSKTGWIKSPKKPIDYPKPMLFKEVFYAG